MISVLMLLSGDCGHTISVRVREDSADANALVAARDAGESSARLGRFCPVCMEDRSFLLPVDAGPAPRFRYRLPLLTFERLTQPLQALDEIVITPVERAYRLWEGSREHGPDRARGMLRNAADIFDRQGRFMEQCGVLEELARRLAEQGDDDGAADIRHSAAGMR